jgi:NADPH2:quinone reductase
LAERAILTESACVAIPEAMTDVQAASFPTSYATALYALKHCGRLQPGEVVLVLGGAGGVGLAAIDVARVMGARVIAAAASQLKRDLCLERGADAVVDYTRGDWRNMLKQLAGPAGVNIVFDPVGGVFAEPALRSLAPGGRFLVVGFASGEIPAISLNLPLLKRICVVGVDWGGAFSADPNLARPIFDQLIDWFVAGRIHPRPGAVYPLERAAEALAAILRREVAGKVVVTLR